MAKYELSDEQIKNLLSIINNAQITGAAAPTIILLAKALQSPIREPNEKESEKK